MRFPSLSAAAYRVGGGNVSSHSETGFSGRMCPIVNGSRSGSHEARRILLEAGENVPDQSLAGTASRH